MKLDVGRGWFSENDLVPAAQFSPADRKIGKPAVPVRVITDKGIQVRGLPIAFVDEGNGKSSIILRTGDGNRRFVTSGETKGIEERVVGINYRP